MITNSVLMRKGGLFGFCIRNELNKIILDLLHYVVAV